MWALSTEQDASEGIGQPKKQLDKENDSCNKCQHDDSRVDGFTVDGTNDVAFVVDETVDEGHVLLVGPMEEIYHIAHIEWQQPQKRSRRQLLCIAKVSGRERRRNAAK